ncbi:MAG TPA: hypothetical protein PLT91_05230 [Clostridia bacterium]|jgi:FSR family fosmidomycin resistance protein-like MFS transporter|nr:MAG: hypothetical protein BWX97_01392 [Firmicutes bacterium ADurb.Bin146]HOD93007.1 hypothetical protein [Clostridia bacterium]HQM39622.1 hypothetical protein [Clostridia bacterium]
MTLIAYSIAHFLTDAVCAGLIFSNPDMIPYILMYDLLAFSTQPITGIIADTLSRYRLFAIAGGILTSFGALFSLPIPIKICMIGIGNSLFHVGGGAAILKGSSSKASPLGIFVAPGSMGLLLGTLFPSITIYAAIALTVVSIILIWLKDYKSKKISEDMPIFKCDKKTVSFLVIAVILISISVRSIASYSVSFSWKDTIVLSLIAGFMVMTGKVAGGFVLDKFKAIPVVIASLLLPGPIIAFLSSYAVPSLLGQFLINISMPLTLYMLYRMIPDYPGFAFGLAASFLFPGMIIGLSINLNGLLILLIFVLNAILMYIAIKVMKKGNITI